MSKFTIVILSALIMVFLSGCLDNSKTSETVTYTDVTVKQAKEMIESGDLFILDVRTQAEYDSGHISGSTLIPVQDIPANELDARLVEIPKDKKILVYCRTARRSAIASDILVNKGFKEVYNMKGGIVEWTNAGYEVVK